MDADFIEKTAFFSEDLAKEAALEDSEGKSVQSVGLVDFNLLNAEAAFLADRVHMILDHHVDNA